MKGRDDSSKKPKIHRSVLRIDYWQATPDIITTAKGISGGYSPLAAAILREEVWLEMAVPIVVPIPMVVDQEALIATRWYAEEAVRKIEAGDYFDARALLLAQVVERLYTLGG